MQHVLILDMFPYTVFMFLLYQILLQTYKFYVSFSICNVHTFSYKINCSGKMELYLVSRAYLSRFPHIIKFMPLSHYKSHFYYKLRLV